MMALLARGSNYSVGEKTLDSQHSVLFSILNGLHAAMMNRSAPGSTGDLLKKLVSYTRDHFAAEEAMMANSNYPGLLHHRVHHRDLTKQVYEFMARHARGDSKINIELLRFLSDWLTNHIQHEDKEYGPWMNRHGLR
jgi:hemerythrin-like metal-binding protein